MPDIFLSYAHQDRERIEPLVERLQQEGWSVWWDRDIVPGKRYEQLIDETIREARCVVVAWSEASLASSWVHNEALEGLELRASARRAPRVSREAPPAPEPKATTQRVKLAGSVPGAAGCLGRD